MRPLLGHGDPSLQGHGDPSLQGHGDPSLQGHGDPSLQGHGDPGRPASPWAGASDRNSGTATRVYKGASAPTKRTPNHPGNAARRHVIAG